MFSNNNKEVKEKKPSFKTSKQCVPALGQITSGFR